jgi:hypothetical protein
MTTIKHQYKTRFLLICLSWLVTTNHTVASDYTQPQISLFSSFQLHHLDHKDINAFLKHGNSLEKQLVLKYLISKRYDFKKLDLLITYYIEIERNDLANFWINWAEENNIDIKPWQKLHIAIIQKDRSLIKHILETNNNQFNQKTFNNTPMFLNKDSTSLAEAHTNYNFDSRNPSIYDTDHHDSTIDFSTSNSTLFSLSTEILDDLSIHNTTISGEIKNTNYNISLTGAKNILDTTRDETLPIEFIEDENDFFIETSKDFSKKTFSLGIGNNSRKKDSITYGIFKYAFKYNEHFNGEFSLDYNRITNTTPILRALGYSNKATLALNFKPDFDYALNFSIDSHEYKTRNNDNIADGYSIITSLVHILSTTPSYWDISLRLSKESNELVESIPSYITTSHVQQTEDIVADENAFVGLGTVYKYGFNNNTNYSTNNFLLNAYTGLTFPNKLFSYGFELEYSYAFSPLNLLGLKVLYSNNYNKIEDNEYFKFIINFKHHF